MGVQEKRRRRRRGDRREEALDDALDGDLDNAALDFFKHLAVEEVSSDVIAAVEAEEVHLQPGFEVVGGYLGVDFQGGSEEGLRGVRTGWGGGERRLCILTLTCWRLVLRLGGVAEGVGDWRGGAGATIPWARVFMGSGEFKAAVKEEERLLRESLQLGGGVGGLEEALVCDELERRSSDKYLSRNDLCRVSVCRVTICRFTRHSFSPACCFWHSCDPAQRAPRRR